MNSMCRQAHTFGNGTGNGSGSRLAEISDNRINCGYMWWLQCKIQQPCDSYIKESDADDESTGDRYQLLDIVILELTIEGLHG